MSHSDGAIEREIVAKGLTAPRVTLADLKANIKHVEYVKHVSHGGGILRWAVITTANGFSVTGRPSAAVSVENDNQEIGEAVALENATAELWPLMGYALKERLFQASLVPCEKGEMLGVQIIDGDKPVLPPHQQRVIDEKHDLDEKMAKLDAFIEGNPIFATLPGTEQGSLRAQLAAMRAYSNILGYRIAGFGGAA